MTLSPEPASVLRGAELRHLPVVTLVERHTRHHSIDSTENVGSQCEATDDGPSIDERLQHAYEAGFASGVEAAEASMAQAVRSAIGSVEMAVAQFDEARRTWAEVGVGETIDLALELAELILRRDVAARQNPGRDAIVRCLGEIEPGEVASIRMHPDDLDQLGEVADVLGGRAFDFVADDSLDPGDAVAELEFGSVDATLRSALERVARELKP